MLNTYFLVLLAMKPRQSAVTRKLISFVLFTIYSHREFPFKLFITTVQDNTCELRVAVFFPENMLIFTIVWF